KARACAFFPLKEKAREKCFGIRARKKQSQKQSQNPGGNPPDPFFLLIILFNVNMLHSRYKAWCCGDVVFTEKKLGACYVEEKET
ncbi:MAG: hypothetical protein H7829_08685, partial [Magnetococcus sp. THC-1_WYH]